MTRVIRFAVTHPVTISMATVAAVVFGLVALGRLDVRLLPEIRYPSLTIQTAYPNTAPLDVENLVTRPLEEAVGVVPGLVRVHSVSQAGLSQITLEFDWDTPMDYAGLEVREKIDLISFPADAFPPILLKYDPTLEPILRIGLWGNQPLVAIRNVAEDVLKKEIESLRGVAAAKVAGGLEEEIQVLVDESRLAALGIPIRDVSVALTEGNVNASGGRLRDRNAEYLVRTLSRFEDLDGILDVAIGDRGGQTVRLADVADVRRGHKERTTITHVDGRESVEIAVFKEGDENVVEVARRVRLHLESIEKRLPDGMKVEVLFDQSVFIAQAVREVRNNAIVGGILAIFVLFVFLRDFRSTAIIGVSIPISIISTFILMYSQNVTLNVMSLGGLALGVGMLVDNSIVVLESIFRRREEAIAEGQVDDSDAIVRGASEVGGAVLGSTLTTIAVFIPIVFVVEGVSGQIFRDQALTVTFSLFVSLVVALTFTPMFAALGRQRRATATAPRAQVTWRDFVPQNRLPYWLRAPWPFLFLGVPTWIAGLSRRAGGFGGRVVSFASRVSDAVLARTYVPAARFYEATLDRSLRRRGLVIVGVVALAAVTAVVFRTIGTEVIPPMSQGELTLALELPEGTPLSRTDTVVSEVGRVLAKIDGITRVAANVGVSREEGASVSRRKENRADVHLKLEHATKASEDAVLERIRAAFVERPDLTLKVQRPQLLSLATPIEVDVYGFEVNDLMATADQVAARMARIEGVRDVQVAMVPGSPEIRVTFDRDKLNQLGLRLAEVAATVQNKVRGSVASQFRDQEKHIDIRVMNHVDQRSTLTSIQDLIVAEREGVPIRLGTIASMDVVEGPAEIHRLGRKRVAIVAANLAGRDLGSATDELRVALRDIPLPAQVSIDLGGQNEEMQRSQRSLRMAILLAVFLVYLVMAAQFESFLYPFIILFTVPLALMGAVLGLAVTGTPLSVIAAIGGIMLAGIVVNNGIVLVDRINQHRRQRMSLHDAVRTASRERFRPILMTTLTTVLGLLPMALGLGEGAELRTPLAITVIFGLSLATLLTLVVVPVAYTLLTPESWTRPERTPAAEPAARGLRVEPRTTGGGR